MGRFDGVKFDAEASANQADLKKVFELVESEVARLTKPSRAQNLIFTALEVAHMWCGKALRDDQLARESKSE